MHHLSKLCLLLSLLCSALISTATHIRSGEIQVRRLNCNSLTFEISLIIYVDSRSSVRVGGTDRLSFGDGTDVIVPELNNIQILDPENSIGKVVFTINYTYASAGLYVLTYTAVNRSEGILNVAGSVTSQFQTETMIVVEPGVCNTFPTLLTEPIDFACQRVAYFHNPVAFDADNDSISYHIVQPKKDNTTPLTDYKNPNDASFYVNVGIPFNQGNETRDGAAIFRLNSSTGLLTWDAPGAIGHYVIAIKVSEWRKDNAGKWFESSYRIRDMEIVVSDCGENKFAPIIDAASETCTTAGELTDLSIQIMDADSDSISFEIFSEFFERYPASIIFLPNESDTHQSPVTINLSIQPTCEMIRRRPYFLTIKAKDHRKGKITLTRFSTISIRVVGPPVSIENVVVNPVTKAVALTWNKADCSSVTGYQIWKRVTSADFIPDKCTTGIPHFLRYDLLATVDADKNTFTDNKLEIGTQYCYRIIALFNAEQVPGRMPDDKCVIPKKAEAPILTNVSVDVSDTELGEVSVRWTSPFEIDKQQYPGPYEYRLFRRNISESTTYAPVSSLISDTVFYDKGLNTNDYVYSYFIELYVPQLSASPVDSSSKASTVFMKSSATPDQIGLSWNAQTPWSLYASKHPYHLIFRSPSYHGPFELIDSVRADLTGLRYSDYGRFKNQKLSNDPYYYKILTRGTYGNPAVIDPLLNYSQVVMGQLLDTIPPCSAVVDLQAINCSQFSCDGKSYYSNLSWRSPDTGCGLDVVAYEVFVKADSSSEFTSLGIVKETHFEHTELTHLDYCYRIVSIDHVGNKSRNTDQVCNASCTTFKLPNVITPGNADHQNDYLMAYDGGNSDPENCARSVKSIELKVYSRWGEEIFVKRVSKDEPLIFWDGHQPSGSQVNSGVYYYKAAVDFQTSDPSRKHQEVHGWLHVLD